MNLISLITADMITDCLQSIITVKREVDSNNFGGVMLERDLAKSLRECGHYVYTQRQIETLLDSNVAFDFNGVEYTQFKRDQKDINSSVYASDLFLFDKQGEVFHLVDSISLKTSINDNDGSKVFIANDAEGVTYDRIVAGELDTKVGQVMIVSLNTDTLNFSVDYFDGELNDLVSVFYKNKVTDENVTYNLKDSIFKGRSQVALTVINRNAVTGKKQTSFNRGVQVRRDFIPHLVEANVFKNVANGRIVECVDELIASLLAVK